MRAPVTAIIVTHNSQDYLELCLQALRGQSFEVSEIIVVDSGSRDREYLQFCVEEYEVLVLHEDNIGYAKGNNTGWKHRSFHNGYTLFLNPDTFLTADFLALAVELLQKNRDTAIISGKLMGFDLASRLPSKKFDSTGVFRTRYGKWYDRGQNVVDIGQYDVEEEVPALCGALMFCRNEALSSLGDGVFDEDFFLYKEDIELSLRIRKRGWKLRYHPDLLAYHCRGWLQNRKEIPFQRRLIASSNEVLLYTKHPSLYIVWALAKYLLVRLFKV